jgi:hypothetical protein
MIEIYLDKLQDLLVNPKDRKLELSLKAFPSGVVVENVRRCAVGDFASIQALIDKGESNKSVSATKMNSKSSRGHTIVTLLITKKTSMGEAKSSTTATINIVDLAGSEKSTSAGTTGDRLAEGNAINKSLTALGNVIKALADKSTGKAKKGAVIPYRDSVLTLLLRDALGGNSSTMMVCAIRPGDLYYEESLSTLKYADRAK